MIDKTNVFQALIKSQPHFLERPLKDLLPMRFMGEVAVNAYRGLIKRLDDLPLSLEEKQSRLKDGQDAGKALLMIEARIGALLESIGKPDGDRIKGGHTQRTALPTLPQGITKQQSHRAQAIHRHPAEVAEVIQEAEDNEDIPTKTAVLNKIALKAEQARRKETEPSSIRMKGEAFVYLTKLQQVVALLPSNPPKNLAERDYLIIKALALLIIKRLEVFQNGKIDKNLPGTGPRLLEGKKEAGPDARDRR